MVTTDLGTILHLFSVVTGIGALILAFEARAQLTRMFALLDGRAPHARPAA